MRILTILFMLAGFAVGLLGTIAAGQIGLRRVERAAARECVRMSDYTDTAVARCYTDRGVPLPAEGKN